MQSNSSHVHSVNMHIDEQTMMKTGHFSLPFWGSILTFLGIVILFTLSYWQMKRLYWKEDVITKLSSAYDSPKPLMPLFRNGQELPEFAYGTIDGKALSDKAIALGTITQDNKIGHYVILPVQSQGKTMLVNLGWSDQAISDLPLRSLKNNTVTYEGLARAPEWNTFTSGNSPDKDIWLRPDIEDIAAAKSLKNVLPYMLYATDTSHSIDPIIAHEKNWYPRNKHKQYAIFWAVMGLCLIGIYILRFTRNTQDEA